MFTPNQRGMLKSMTGRNLDGEEIYSDPTPIGLSVVNLLSVSQKTSVRTDSSASHGNADEMTADGKFLSNAKPAIDDIIVFAGQSFRVKGNHPRYTVLGIFDHYEIVVELVDE